MSSSMSSSALRSVASSSTLDGKCDSPVHTHSDLDSAGRSNSDPEMSPRPSRLSLSCTSLESLGYSISSRSVTHHNSQRVKPYHRGPVKTTESVNGEPTDLVTTPWYPSGVSHQNVRLNSEVEVFSKYVVLTTAECRARNAVRAAVQEGVSKVWPECITKVFGSFAYGLSLPCSELDLVCEGCTDLSMLPRAVECLQALPLNVTYVQSSPDKAFLKVEANGIIANVTCIPGHRFLPRQAATMMKGWLAEYPVAIQVFNIIRAVLSQAKLTDPANGGISSYALLAMVVYICRITPQPHEADKVIFAFLQHYCDKFDFEENAINPAAPFPVPKTTTEDFVIADPLNPKNNLVGQCTKFNEIRLQFQYCRMALSKWDTSNPGAKKGYKGRTPISSLISHQWATNAKTGVLRH